MIQLFCPACENVVWVEETDNGEPVCCPECSHTIQVSGKRKARPLSESADRSATRPAPTGSHVVPASEARQPAPFDPLPPPDVANEAIEDAQLDEETEGVPEEGEFCVAWSEPAPRYVALPYRAEGGCDPLRLPLPFLAIPAGAILLGWLASALGQAWYLILLFPLAMGAALAGLGAAVVRGARLRNTTVAALAGLIAGVTAIAAMHYFDYREALRLWRAGSVAFPEALGEALDADASFRSYLDTTARIGMTVSDRTNATGFNFGYPGTYVYWGAELLVVSGLALFGARSAAARPFCSRCGQWKQERFLGTLREPGEEVGTLLRKGNLVGLLEYRPAPEGGELAVSAAVCPCCAKEAPVDVRLERVTAGKHRPAGELASLSFPGESLPLLEQLFLTPATAS